MRSLAVLAGSMQCSLAPATDTPAVSRLLRMRGFTEE